jgi:hypothetical protein
MSIIENLCFLFRISMNTVTTLRSVCACSVTLYMSLFTYAHICQQPLINAVTYELQLFYAMLA